MRGESGKVGFEYCPDCSLCEGPWASCFISSVLVNCHLVTCKMGLLGLSDNVQEYLAARPGAKLTLNIRQFPFSFLKLCFAEALD